MLSFLGWLLPLKAIRGGTGSESSPATNRTTPQQLPNRRFQLVISHDASRPAVHILTQTV